MKVHQQRVLRFDVDPIVLQPNYPALREYISVTPEYDIYSTDPLLKLLRLVWKVHYTGIDSENEIVGLLIEHDHLLDVNDLNTNSLRRLLSSSALNVQTKLEDRISAQFSSTSKMHTVATVSFANKILNDLLNL